MGATSSKREPNGPGSSRVFDLFKPEKPEMIDYMSKIGIIRIFWIRKELKNQKPPLVLLHGWGAGTGYYFKFNKFIARDRAVLYIDLPGFGESERMEIKDPLITFPEILEETIFSQINGNFFLAGHSFGGWMGSMTSLRPGMKERLEGLILMDSEGYRKTPMKNVGALEKFVDRCGLAFSDCFGNIGVISILHMMPDCMEVWILKKTQKDIADNQGPKQLEYIAQINTIKPPTGDTAFHSLYQDDVMIPKKSVIECIHEAPERYPKNVLFLWGTESFFSPVEAEMLEDFYLENDSYNTQIKTKYIIGADHQFPGTHSEETANIINKFISDIEKNS